MRSRRREAGFSLIELLVSVTLLLVCLSAAAAMTAESSRRNKSRQIAMTLQADARNVMTIIENTLRSAGWDPTNSGLAGLVLDPDPSGPDNFIEAIADLNGDGDVNDPGEHVTIRHHAGRIEWRTRSDPSAPFVILAESITNDADGDGTIEPMFLPDSASSPRRITVTITARAPVAEPGTGARSQYTISSAVVLRDRL